MTIKERAQVLYDFSSGLSTERKCKDCGASGVICDTTQQVKARDNVCNETADILRQLSGYEKPHLIETGG